MMRVLLPAHTSSICRLGASIIKSLDYAHSKLMALSSSLYTAGCTLTDSQGSHLPLSLALISLSYKLIEDSLKLECRIFIFSFPWSVSPFSKTYSPTLFNTFSLLPKCFHSHQFPLRLFSSHADNSWNSRSLGVTSSQCYSPFASSIPCAIRYSPHTLISQGFYTQLKALILCRQIVASLVRFITEYYSLVLISTTIKTTQLLSSCNTNWFPLSYLLYHRVKHWHHTSATWPFLQVLRCSATTLDYSQKTLF